MTTFKTTPKTKVIRGAKRATYEKSTIYDIIDEAYIAHIGAQMSDKPMVQPTAHWRHGNRLYIHGSAKNALFQALKSGVEACVNITLLDGLVLARSAFHHSMNYRSVMIFGKAIFLNDATEKKIALDHFMEKITPDRLKAIRSPSTQELKATDVAYFELEEVSAKIRTGPPVDDEDDYLLDVWAGVIPLNLVKGQPIKD